MSAYVVRWEIEVDAESPEEAVDLACQMLPVAGNETTATFFGVCPEADADDPNVQWQSVDIRE